MTYSEALDYLYTRHPAFERQGAPAYKPGLSTSRSLAALFGDPQSRYPIIHVAGTNGKGSVSNMLSACLQQAGYRVGLFTSPHLVDFRERIRVNGQEISKAFVIGWLGRYRRIANGLEPSFFELTTAMAFSYFAHAGVDVAVIEVGLGGRLDSTNIVTPVLSVITNISMEHTDLLGHTLAEIANEKAGIIKPGVPVVVGESGPEEVKNVFARRARQCNAPIVFADDRPLARDYAGMNGRLVFTAIGYGPMTCDLAGDYQCANINTTLTALELLKSQGYRLEPETVTAALSNVAGLTHFVGRWTVLGQKPLIVCDAAHNVAGVSAIMRQLSGIECHRLHIVMGMMRDKDIEALLRLWPRDARYYFTQAKGSRALPAVELQQRASTHGLDGNCYPTVEEAFAAALTAAAEDDAIFVGGSMYVMGEVLALVPKHKM